MIQKQLSLFFLCAAIWNGIGQTLEEQYDKALKQIDANNYPAAILELEEAIMMAPEVDSVYALRAFCLSQLNQPDKAMVDCNRAISLNPGSAYAYYVRGFTKSIKPLEAGELDKILLDPELIGNPDKIKAFELRYKTASSGSILTIYDYGDAIADLDRSITYDPAYADAYNLRGNLYHELNQLEKARSDYENAIEMDPNDPFYYADRARLYRDLQSPLKALEDLNRAIALKPDGVLFYANRGYLKFDLKDKTGACADLRMATKLGLYIDNFDTYCN